MTGHAELAISRGPGFVLQRARAAPSAAPLCPHFHLEYLICAQLRGREACAVDGRLHHLKAGDLVLINPEQVHTGHAGAGETIEYLSLYGEPGWIAGIAAGLASAGGRRRRATEFLEVRVSAAPLVDGLQRLWTASGGRGDPAAALALEEGATLLVTRALRDFADLGGGRRRSARRPPPRRIRRVVDHLHQREAATDLDALAAVAGLSKFHFIRHFAAEIGMTPAAYLRTLRISEAARELRRGASIEAAAAGAGFTNMTSFGRAFRSIVGTTPRRYARDAGGGPRLG